MRYCIINRDLLPLDELEFTPVGESIIEVDSDGVMKLH